MQRIGDHDAVERWEVQPIREIPDHRVDPRALSAAQVTGYFAERLRVAIHGVHRAAPAQQGRDRTRERSRTGPEVRPGGRALGHGGTDERDRFVLFQP
jgi:hypothetical protein